MSTSSFFQPLYQFQQYDRPYHQQRDQPPDQQLFTYQYDPYFALYPTMTAPNMEGEGTYILPGSEGTLAERYRPQSATQQVSSPSLNTNTPASSTELNAQQLLYRDMDASSGYTSDSSWDMLGSSQGEQSPLGFGTFNSIIAHTERLTEEAAVSFRNAQTYEANTVGTTSFQGQAGSPSHAAGMTAMGMSSQYPFSGSSWSPVTHGFQPGFYGYNTEGTNQQDQGQWCHVEPTHGVNPTPTTSDLRTRNSQNDPSLFAGHDESLSLVRPDQLPFNALALSERNTLPHAHGAVAGSITERPLRKLKALKSPATEDHTGASPKKGGRKGALTERTRLQAGTTRRAVSCWVCAMQRDHCRGGEICDRCIRRATRGDMNRLDCVRKELATMATVFLPESMIAMHQRDSLIAYVRDRATSWRGTGNASGILADLSIGFGPSFPWLLHEFTPAWPSLLLRSDNIWDEEQQAWKTVSNRSPPLGVQFLPASTGDSLSGFLDSVVLEDLQGLSNAYNDEGDEFKSKMLHMLCGLLNNTWKAKSDKKLQEDLKNVLKMVAATYVMNHPLSITRESRDEVVRRLSGDQNPEDYPEKPSPWMASMQLRCFFALVRHNIYMENLGDLQQILHRSTGKTQRTSAFVFVLGMALVLEECQHTILLQAQGKVDRREADKATAWLNVAYECGEIDHEFEFLRTLLHCKFQTSKMTQKASLRDWIDTAKSPTDKAFLQDIYEEAINNKEYLESRKDLILRSAQENNQSSRLVAKLLLDLI